MKKLVVKNIQDCEACRSCEMACAQAYYKTDDAEYSCIHIGGTAAMVKIDLCTQCGKCADVCPVEAISQNAQGVYMISRKTCVGCLACMDICPADVICKSPQNVFATKCTSCGICVKACPKDVLAIETV